VHDDRQLSGDRDRGPFEAQPLTQFKSPAPETAFVPGTGSCEEYRRRFVKQSAQMVVASSLRIPMKPAIDSDLKPASHSDFIPASVPM
jgi:hypothetical protein